MNKKYYVISGNQKEYWDFANQKCSELWSKGHDISLSNFIHVTHETTLSGVQNPHGWLYGTWLDNPNIENILYKMASCYQGELVPESIIEAWETLKGSND